MIALFYKQTKISDELSKSWILISSFISSYYFSTLFELIKSLEIKTSMLFDLVFANNAILLCLFFFYLIIDLQFLIPEIIAQILNLIAGLVIPIGIPCKQAKPEMERHPVTAEIK